MAERLDDFEFTGRGGKNRRYPWDQWLDGNIWKLTQGVDFEVTPASLRNQASIAAYKRDGYCRTSLRLGDGIVVLQFYTKEA